MNVWLEPGLPRFLLNTAVAAIVVAVLGWLATLLLRNARVEWRIAAIHVCFLAMLATPFIAAVGRPVSSIGISLPSSNFQPELTPQSSQTEGQISAHIAQSAQPPNPEQQTLPTSTAISPTIVAALWALISSTLLIRTGIRRLALGAWLSRKSKHTEVIAHGRKGILVCEADVPAPFCGGIWRPFVAIPTDFVNLPEAEKRAVMAHEVAHLAYSHPYQRLISEVASSIFGWIPLLGFLKQQLSDAQEQQCDEAVLRKVGDGLDLAKGLVRFAERLGAKAEPAAALSIVRRSSSLETRVNRLTQSGGPPMPPAKLIVNLFACTAGCALMAIAIAAQVQDNPLDTIKRYLPFKEGTVWTYRVAYSSPRQKDGELRVTALAMKANKPHPVMEFQQNFDKYKRYEYWMATSAGLVPVDNSNMGDLPGFRIGQYRAPRLPIQLRQGYEWQWSEEFRGQVMMGRDGKAQETLETKFWGRVVAVDKPIEVKFRKVSAVVVEVRAVGPMGNGITRYYWAKDVGLAKMEYIDPTGLSSRVEELVSKTASK